jgi:hypothetical protein
MPLSFIKLNLLFFLCSSLPDLELSDNDIEILRAVALKLKHNLSTQCFNDLRRAFPNSSIQSWAAAQTTLLRISGIAPILYDCCTNSCCAYTGRHKEKKFCPYCKQPRFNKKGRPRRRFSYIRLIPRLQALYGNQDLARRMLYRSEKFPHHEDKMKDIFDGLNYESLLGKHVTINDRVLKHLFFSGHRDVAVGFSTDGYSPHKRKAKTAWPLVIYNYNLPPEERFQNENIIVLGVIPGPKKPHDFDSFAWPMVEEMLALAVGVKTWDANTKEFFMLRAYLIIIFGDIPAVSMLMRMKGHNGKCPCRFCMIRGIRAPGETKGTLYVPLDRTQHPGAEDDEGTLKYEPLNLPCRTHTEFMDQARQVQFAERENLSEALATKFGVKGIPLLSHLPSLFFPRSSPYDFMHLVWENVQNNLLQLWTGKYKGLDTGTGDYKLSAEDLKTIGKLGEASGSSIPYAFGARPPNIASEQVSWTAETRSFWTTFVAPVLLKNRLPEPYFRHFLDFVRLINICLKFETPRSDVQVVREGFAAWVKRYEEYVDLLVPFTHHSSTTISDCTINMTPSGFPHVLLPYMHFCILQMALSTQDLCGQDGLTQPSAYAVASSGRSKDAVFRMPVSTNMCCTRHNLLWSSFGTPRLGRSLH